MRQAVYAGSFDPITRGHTNIVRKALETFDIVNVAIGTNPAKTRTFPVDQSLELIRQTMHESFPQAMAEGRIVVTEFTGRSLASYAREIGAKHIVRGLRQISDFNDEFTFTGANEQIATDITIVHFICKAKYLHVSSSMARDLAKLGEDVNWLVGPAVRKALTERFRAQ